MKTPRKGDTVLLLNGAIGKIDFVIKTNNSIVYKISYAVDTMEGYMQQEGYYEKDKFKVLRRHPVNKLLDWFTFR